MKVKTRLKIIIPALNEERTIVGTIKSLAAQSFTTFQEVILCVVNDGSSDRTAEVAEKSFKEHFSGSRFRFEIINHPQPRGISRSQNDALHDYENFDTIVLCQADIIFQDNRTLERLYSKIENDDLLATYPYVVHEEDQWEAYPFWQKILLDRQLDRRAESKIAKLSMLTKDCVKLVGLFDEDLTGTEDRDYYERVRAKGAIEVTDIDIIHMHNAANTFPAKKLIYKEGQQAEGSASMIRKYGLGSNLKQIVFVLFRPGVAILNLIPLINFISIPITILFFLLYSRNTIVYTLKKVFDFRIFLLIPVLTFSLYMSTYVFFKSLLTGKVNHFRNK